MTAAARRERSLVDIIGEALEAEDLQLPVYSTVAVRVQALAARDDTSAEQIERVLMHDPALASQILRVANSAFYAGLSQVDTVRAAILRLGLAQIVELAVMCTQRAQYRSSDPVVHDIMQRLWQHAMACAFGAKWLAERAGYRDRAGEAFMGGLLHDIGKLLIVKVIEDLRQRGEWPGDVPVTLLMDLLSTLHAAQGARLIERWNLSETYARIARDHHSEHMEDADIPLLVVRIANRVCSKLGFNLQKDPEVVPAALPEVALLGIGEVMLAELEITLEDGMQKLLS